MPRFAQTLTGLLTASLLLTLVPFVALAQGDTRKRAADFEHVHALAVDAGGQVLFLGAHTGLFRSEDGGRSWQKVALSTKHAHLDVMAIAADPKDPLVIYDVISALASTQPSHRLGPQRMSQPHSEEGGQDDGTCWGGSSQTGLAGCGADR